MIFGIGTDMVDIGRIEKAIARHGDKFLMRCFTPDEIAACQKRGLDRQTATYAKLYAAKEAVLKASGRGMSENISWHDIEIGHEDSGKPNVQLTGGLLEAINTDISRSFPDHQKMPVYIDLSLSDEPPYAIAFAVISLSPDRQ